MADKLNMEGFSVSTGNVCTADGGFIGPTALSGAATLTGNEGFVMITGDVIVAAQDATSTGKTLTIKRETSKGSNTATFLGTLPIDGQSNTVTFDSKEYITLVFGPGGAGGGGLTWNVTSTDADISLV